jgi:cytochrome b6-f complex iron-sulfur subunit
MLTIDSGDDPMGIHENHEREEQHQGGSHHSRGLWMVICCSVPLVLIVLLSFLGILGAWGFYGLILLCPVIHFIVMKRMGAKQKR